MSAVSTTTPKPAGSGPDTAKTTAAAVATKNSSKNNNNDNELKPKDSQLSAAAAAAQYHKQLRHGVYDNPGAPIVGVSTNSSGSAAVLAHKSQDLSPSLWHREKDSPNAGTAAILADQNKSSMPAWKPDTSASAATAALYVKDMDPAHDDTSDKTSAAGAAAALKERNAFRAATSAHKTPASEFAAQKLPDAYTWRANVDNSVDIGRSASMHVYKKDRKDDHAASGIQQQSQQQHQAQQTKRNRSSSVNSGAAPSINLGNLESKARAQATKRLSGLQKPEPSVYASVDRDRFNAQHAAASSSVAARHDLGEDEQEAKAKEHDRLVKESIQQHESLMKAARANATNSLSRIDSQVGERYLFGNHKYNQAALNIAEQNAKSRLEHHGKIDMGGGMYMTQSEVETIAQRNVAPVLTEISEKAELQRQQDEERRQAEESERLKKAEEKRLNQERKQEDKRLKREEHQKHRAEKDRQKQIDHERKAKLKQERRELAEQRKQERIQLKNAAEAKKNAEEMAKNEVAKVSALQEAAHAKVEAAKMKEQEADDAAKAEEARLEREAHERELQEANEELDTAMEHHTMTEQESKQAETMVDDHDRQSEMLQQEELSEDDENENEEGDVLSNTERAGAPGLTMGALQGPDASELALAGDKNKKGKSKVYNDQDDDDNDWELVGDGESVGVKEVKTTPVNTTNAAKAKKPEEPVQEESPKKNRMSGLMTSLKNAPTRIRGLSVNKKDDSQQQQQQQQQSPQKDHQSPGSPIKKLTDKSTPRMLWNRDREHTHKTDKQPIPTYSDRIENDPSAKNSSSLAATAARAASTTDQKNVSGDGGGSAAAGGAASGRRNDAPLSSEAQNKFSGFSDDEDDGDYEDGLAEKVKHKAEELSEKVHKKGQGVFTEEIS